MSVTSSNSSDADLVSTITTTNGNETTSFSGPTAPAPPKISYAQMAQRPHLKAAFDLSDNSSNASDSSSSSDSFKPSASNSNKTDNTSSSNKNNQNGSSQN